MKEHIDTDVITPLAVNVSGAFFDEYPDVPGCKLIYEDKKIYYTECVSEAHEKGVGALRAVLHACLTRQNRRGIFGLLDTESARKLKVSLYGVYLFIFR